MKPSRATLSGLFLLLVACPKEAPVEPPITVEPPAPEAPVMPLLAPDIPARLAQLPATVVDYPRALLDEKETAVLAKLIEAARIIDELYLVQVDPGNPKVREDLVAAARLSEPHVPALALFDIMHGRWDRLAEDEPFVGPLGASGHKAPGAGFYPADMSKEELEAWLAAHPEDRDAFTSPYTVIRRKEGVPDSLVAVPYGEAYRAWLEPAAARLREAASMTGNASLRSFLEKRADAFLSNDYYASDVAWMDLDSPIEIVIGPEEVYEDGLFNYKASFESFVCVYDHGESEKLKRYAGHLVEMEKALPIPDKYKNLKRGGESPIRVVLEAYTSGDARNGVQTAAFNLPNDERVRQDKGSKKVMLKNVMEAKFGMSGRPIGSRVLDPSLVQDLSFDAYFTFVLFHEIAHGLGPGIIQGPDGKPVENRLLLKETYSVIEECKADVVGAWNVLLGIDRKWVTGFTPAQYYATNLGLLFRSMRFGLDEAHGRANAIQWNWYREKGAILPSENGTFKIDMKVARKATKDLATEVLMIEALGDYARARALVDKYGVSTPEIRAVIDSLKDIPVDITPVFPAAGEGR